MLRSLYSGVSGMKNQQIKLDVTGNNIANVGTTAYKSGRVRFQEILGQTLRGASAPGTNGRGGVNARQVGLGMQVAGIDTITNQGSPQPTGRPLDCAVDGEGYFIISSTGQANNVVYTRDGSFGLDAQYHIINSDGLRLMGYAANNGTISNPLPGLSALSIPATKNGAANGAKLTDYTIEQDGTIKAMYEGDTQPYTLGRIALAKFPNPGGLVKVGNNNYNVSANSGTAEVGAPDQGGYGKVLQSTLEMSNVDLASEFTDMIITSRSFQANSRTITTSDEMLQELLNLKR